jgi:putative redox protein
MSKPPVAVALTWDGELRLKATSAGTQLTIDGDSQAGASPVQMLAASLAACMVIDIVSILQKGRHPLQGLTAHLSGERAQEHPHRFLRFTLTCEVVGDVPGAAVERAIALSREKYCSVWHSLREDIELTVSFEVHV